MRPNPHPLPPFQGRVRRQPAKALAVTEGAWNGPALGALLALMACAGGEPPGAAPDPAADPSGAAPVGPPPEPRAPSAAPEPAAGTTNPTAWSGTWDFPKMALQLDIVDHAGTFAVSATSTAAKAKARPPAPCEPVVLTDELACTLHSATDDKVLNIRLRPGGADPDAGDFLTLLVGDYPVEVGSRVGLQGESVSEP